MSEDSFDFVLKGYDVSVFETDDPTVFDVKLYASGGEVFDGLVPVTLTDEDLLVEDAVNHAAEAAIDLFEADKGFLGQGAGALEVEAMKKKACYFLETENYEQWYRTLQGTIYEQQAIVLLEELLNARASQPSEQELNDLFAELSAVEAELDQLNLEWLKTSEPPKQIVVIEASSKRRACSDLDWVEGFISKFKGHRLEAQVLLKVKEMIDLQERISLASKKQDEEWEIVRDIRSRMEALMVEKTKADVDTSLPESGIEVAPNMAGDIAELMEGVSFEEPLEPMVAKRISRTRAILLAKHTAGKINRRMRRAIDSEADAFEGEREVTELGSVHEGIDPAEIEEEKRIPFGPGNYIKLKKKVEIPLWGGAKRTIEKGTKGWVDSLYDGHGDRFYVRLPNGSLFSVDRDLLEKA